MGACLKCFMVLRSRCKADWKSSTPEVGLGRPGLAEADLPDRAMKAGSPQRPGRPGDLGLQTKDIMSPDTCELWPRLIVGFICPYLKHWHNITHTTSTTGVSQFSYFV
ncbi:hypothetical protein J6590_024579 [Homalodisca vitripennis]|nr:hypothetical protein J6590_024579 [Homalodisca vitripennis]